MALLMVALELLMVLAYNCTASLSAALLAVLALSVWVLNLLRNQVGVGSVQYLQAMIQHHSSAILTSEAILRKTEDSETKALAQQIIDSQKAEIAQMNAIIIRLSCHPHRCLC